jgi:Tetratricopeptide repeat
MSGTINPTETAIPSVKSSTRTTVIVLAILGLLFLLCGIAVVLFYVVFPFTQVTPLPESEILAARMGGFIIAEVISAPGIILIIAALGVWLFYWRKTDEVKSNDSLFIRIPSEEPAQPPPSTTLLPAPDPLSRNPVTSQPAGSKGAAFVTFVLLATLGMFWIGVALAQFAIVIGGRAPSSSDLTMTAVWNLVASGINLFFTRNVIRRQANVVKYLVYLAILGSIWGGISLATGANIQILAIPMYILLGILAYTNRKYYTVIGGGPILRPNQLTEETDAILAAPGQAGPYINRGVSYATQMNFMGAGFDFDKAISIEPQLACAYFNRGLALALDKKYDRAVPDLSRAIELDPNFAAAWYMRGKVYIETRQPDKAMLDLKKALSLEEGPELRVRTLDLIRKAQRWKLLI